MICPMIQKVIYWGEMEAEEEDGFEDLPFDMADRCLMSLSSNEGVIYTAKLSRINL